MRICEACSYSSLPCFSKPPRFGSTKKAIATVWLPRSPSPGRNRRIRGLAPLGPRSRGLRFPVRQREDTRASGRPETSASAPAPPATVPSPRPAPARRLPTGGGAGPSACARRSRACRPHSPHPPRELVTSCPRPISVRGQSVAPCRCRRVSASPFLPAPRRWLRLFGEGETEEARDWLNKVS